MKRSGNLRDIDDISDYRNVGAVDIDNYIKDFYFCSMEIPCIIFTY